MDVLFRFLHHPDRLRGRLQRDGWALGPTTPAGQRVTHPAVPDEAAARTRLARLGLLTAGSVQIDFGPPATARAPARPPLG